MKVLVTVGTSAFDSLIRAVDFVSEEAGDWHVLAQIGPGRYIPGNLDWIRFRAGLLSETFDVVISHCGAGSIYSLLERQLPFVAVPNLERADPHQRELGEYLESERLAPVVWRTEQLTTAVRAALNQRNAFAPYRKETFSAGNEIAAFLRGAGG